MANVNTIVPVSAGYLTFLTSCKGQTILPPGGGPTRLRRTSRFTSFDGESSISTAGTNPTPIQSPTFLTSPARWARLLLLAYRNRHLYPPPIYQIPSNPIVFLNYCCRREIFVFERARRPDGMRPLYPGETSAIVKTVYTNGCSVDEIRNALLDIMRVQDGIDAGVPFSAICSGCEQCPPFITTTTLTTAAREPHPCFDPQCALPPNQRQNPYVPAGPYTCLTAQDIDEIINWWQTLIPYVPPAM
jgi:hypothetical protein